MCELSKTQLSLQLPQVMTCLSDLYVRQELTDLTISCPNGELMAHKLVLSSVSNYFRQQFFTNNKTDTNCLIIFNDISIQDIKTVIDCIYFGKQLVSIYRSQNLLKIAQRLQINLISTQKNANKNRPIFGNKSSCADTTTPQTAHQNYLQVCAQKHLQKGVIINEMQNDISFEVELNELPLDLTFNESGDQSVTTIGTNKRKKRNRKQSEPKRKVDYNIDINGIAVQESTEESKGYQLEDVLEEITASFSNIPESQQTIDELSTLTDNQLNVNDIPVKISIANSYENTIESVVNSGVIYCVKKEPKESINELKDCSLCEKKFPNEKQLMVHMKKEHRNEKEVFNCQFCDQSFKWAKKFALHLISCKNQF